MKYVIINKRRPIIFPETINHDDMVRYLEYGDKITGAGFINMGDDGQMYTRGESYTWKLASHKDDSEIIKKHMREY